MINFIFKCKAIHNSHHEVSEVPARCWSIPVCEEHYSFYLDKIKNIESLIKEFIGKEWKDLPTVYQCICGGNSRHDYFSCEERYSKDDVIKFKKDKIANIGWYEKLQKAKGPLNYIKYRESISLDDYVSPIILE